MRRRDFNRHLLAAAGATALPVLGAAVPGESDAGSIAGSSAQSTAAPVPTGSLTDIVGLRVGHFTDRRRPTGCTVVLCPAGAVGGVDVRGGAPGTRETDLLRPINTVQRVFAIVLAGGSAFGLDAASGAMRYLAEQNVGYAVGPTIRVPIVPAAILFDLDVGSDWKICPTAESGYAACQAAGEGPVTEGNVGAGAGATVGKLFGRRFAMKSGLGTVSLRAGASGVVVGALAAVNAAGDVRDPETGAILAGARTADGRDFRDTMAQIRNGYSVLRPTAGANTTLGVVATNAKLGKDAATKIAQMAQDGLARAINPVHTPADGDTVFALATGTLSARVNESAIGALAAEAMARAIVRAVSQAEGIPGYPAWRNLRPRP